MISVTRINGKPLLLNAELIEYVETTPDTVITTTSGKKIIVSDSAEDVVKKVFEYRRIIFPYKELIRDIEQEVRDFIRNSK